VNRTWKACGGEVNSWSVLAIIALAACRVASGALGGESRGNVLRDSESEKITVDASRVLNDTRRRQIGINTCFLTDDDKSYLHSPKGPFDEALKELSPAYLRYPGGWKSDIVLWSMPPYTKSQPTLARPQAAYFPANDRALVNPDGSWRIDPYDFDEFMTTCKAVGAEPVVVVCYNSYRWSLDFDETPRPTRRQIIDTAAAWVRYANKVKDYNVKYWEIGNEPWLPTEEQGKTSTIPPEVYAEDVVEMSRRMKEVDPTILVGANALHTDAWTTILNRAAEHVDFLVVHPYPFYGWEGYDTYLRQDPDTLYCVRWAKDAIQANPIATRRQLQIMVTEFAAGAFNQWDRSGADVIDRRSERWVSRGTSPTDKKPTWDKVGSVKVAGDTLATSLDPVSVTVFSFSLVPSSGLEEN